MPCHPYSLPFLLQQYCLVCLLYPFLDQIDENLKLALQQDLTTMAPGLIIQVMKNAGIYPKKKILVQNWIECSMFWFQDLFTFLKMIEGPQRTLANVGYI